MYALPLQSQQRGVALAVALILLLVITMLALSGVRLSTMELRMSLNDELRVNAIEQSQSLVDGAIRRFANTPILAPGVTLCARTVSGVCTDTRVVLPAAFADELAGNQVNVLIQRIPPQNAEPPVGTGFSLTSFDAAYIQVSGLYDKNSLGLGAARVNEGIAVVYGAAGDITTTSASDEFGGAVPPP